MPGIDPLSAVPVLGSLGSTILQRSWALRDLKRQQEYNKPLNQVRRLREAGLPLASMFSGSGGSTSEQPRATEVDPTLGTAKGLETFFQNRMQRKQLELFDEQIRSAKAKADEDEGHRDWMLDQMGIEPTTNQGRLLELGKSKTAAEAWIANNQAHINDIEAQLKKSLFDEGVLEDQFKSGVDVLKAEKALKDQNVQSLIQQIAESMQRTKNLGQDYTINELIEKINNQILNDLNNGSGFNAWMGAIIKKLIR